MYFQAQRTLAARMLPQRLDPLLAIPNSRGRLQRRMRLLELGLTEECALPTSAAGTLSESSVGGRLRDACVGSVLVAAVGLGEASTVHRSYFGKVIDG